MVSHEQRISPRYAVNKDCFFFPPKGEKFPCTVNNISATGICLSAHKKLKKDDVIILQFAAKKDMYLTAQVVWELSGEYGLLFLLETSRDIANISYIMNNTVMLSK